MKMSRQRQSDEEEGRIMIRITTQDAVEAILQQRIREVSGRAA